MARDIAEGRLLRQLGSGHIYPWTEVLAKRKDMVAYDSEVAHKRIQALKDALASQKAAKEPDSASMKQHAAELKDAQKLAKELTELEELVYGDKDRPDGAVPPPEKKLQETPKDDDEAAAQERDKVIQNDPHIIRIMGMKRKVDVAGYLLQEFGKELEGDPKLTELQNTAISLRTERLFEGQDL